MGAPGRGPLPPPTPGGRLRPVDRREVVNGVRCRVREGWLHLAGPPARPAPVGHSPRVHPPLAPGRRPAAAHDARRAQTRAEDLNTLDRYRRESLADADFQARAARLVPLLRGPVATVVPEELLPVSGNGPVGVGQASAGFPALGQERRFREAIEEFVRASQAAGVRIGMGIRLFSSIGPVVEVTNAYPDLAALEQTRKERAEATRPVLQAVAGLSREPNQVRVFEVLVPFPR